MRSADVERLSDEDRVLWALVARSTKPLEGKSTPRVLRAASSQPKHAPQVEPAKSVAPAAPYLPSYQAPPQTSHRLPAHLDAQTVDKLSKGRLPIEARVDLHGMRQDQAHALLLSFLARAHQRGARYVLVITGKGSASGGDGVLRRSVPAWLNTAPFRPHVSGHEPSGRGHGGGGALYVRLKRHRTEEI